MPFKIFFWATGITNMLIFVLKMSKILQRTQICKIDWNSTSSISEESTNSKQKKKNAGGINQWIESREVRKDFTEITFELSFENVLMQLKTMCITSWGKRVSKSLIHCQIE